MTGEYLLLKFFHILIAILALGTSAGLGIALEFYGSPTGRFSFVPSGGLLRFSCSQDTC
jgi:uncharacterized membrane protein